MYIVSTIWREYPKNDDKNCPASTGILKDQTLLREAPASEGIWASEYPGLFEIYFGLELQSCCPSFSLLTLVTVHRRNRT